MKKRMLSIFMAFCMIFPLAVTAGASPLNDSPESTFNITVVDEQGNAIPSSKISLYSYLDKQVVLNATASTSGSCKLHYTPTVDPEKMSKLNAEQGSTEDVLYADYMIYVSKPGYQDELYTLTKTFSPSGKIDCDAANQGDITITMKPSTISASKKTSSDPIYQYLVNTGKISDESPIYILQPEDTIELQKQGVISSVTPKASFTNINNVNVPVGEFHVVKGATLNVKFYTSDSLKVQSKADSGSGWSVSGSVSRNFSETASYAPFSITADTAGRKKVYYVMGDFIKETTYITGGQVRQVMRLNKLRASTAVSATSICNTCMKSYSSVSNNDGLIRTVNPNSHIVYGKGKTVSLGLSASVSGISLGVTRTTKTSTEIKCSNSSSKTLKMYDKGTNEAVYHMTHN